ncbi:MAG: hypothetical protein ABSH06_29405 [Thermodesulfobacteriota bacterium]|jgi:hypothetical protein
MVTLDEMREANGKSFAEKMDQGGITDDELIKLLKSKLNATDTRPFNNKGSIIYAKPLEAHEIQLKAADMCFRLKNQYPAERKHVSFEGGVPIVPLSEEDQIELEAMKEVVKGRLKKSE